MSAQGAFKIAEEFEAELCRYTGAPYAVAVDNCSNAIFLALMRSGMRRFGRLGLNGERVSIPANTYPSVPCEIIHAGGVVDFDPLSSAFTCAYPHGACKPECNIRECTSHIRGPYQLGDTGVWDSALRFTCDQYNAGQTQCLSFTGPYKHLKLGKGGAILTDSAEDAAWYKRARFSGRRECSYHDDNLDMLGWNFYMPVETAARGLHLIAGMWRNGVPVMNNDLCLKFPDLRRFPVYRQESAAAAPAETDRARAAFEPFEVRPDEGSHSEELQRLSAAYARAGDRGSADFLSPDQIGYGANVHVGAQSFQVIAEESPAPAAPSSPGEPCPDYYAYRGDRL